MKPTLIVLLLFLFSVQSAMSQKPIGSWRDHLSYANVKKVKQFGDKIYCITEFGYFIYNTSDNSMQKFTTTSGLSDASISDMAYSEEKDLLFISYENGNIDIVQNGKITNIPDLKNKVLASNKGANAILFYGNYAYCSHGFGIMVVDLAKNEIKDTYTLGEQGVVYTVNSLVIYDNYFYVATNYGLFKASVSDPFLIDFSRWQRVNSIPLPTRAIKDIVMFQDKMVVGIAAGYWADSLYMFNNTSWIKVFTEVDTLINDISVSDNHLVISARGHIYAFDKNYQKVKDYDKFIPKSAIVDNNNNLWVGDWGNGLIKEPLNGGDFSYYYPPGPGSNSIWNMKAHFNQILVTGGAVDRAWSNVYLPGMVFRYRDEMWNNLVSGSGRDFISVAGDPVNEDKYYVGSWGQGVFVYENNKLLVNYTNKNSSIQNLDWAGANYMFIGGIAFDNNNNMWLTNQFVPSSISVRKADTTWHSNHYDMIQGIKNGGTIGDILCDINGCIWVLFPRGSGGLFVFNPNGTPEDESDDDKTDFFSPFDAYEKSIGVVYSFASDKDGSVWVGTENGVVVYTNPLGVFDGETKGYQPRIPRVGTGFVDPLLGGETVYCIAVDGANRKWFGTENGGAYLISADGTKQLKNFTTENSPLISNFVRTIAIQPTTGEVFFGTDKGIVSYRDVATEGNTDLSGAYVFPNPVRPEYSGNVTVTGLVENTSVKITDISGTLVFQTTSLGGSAIWDGKNSRGQKVASGIYLIFLTNEDGSLTNIVKLLVVR